MGAAEAVAGRGLPAEADADAYGPLPTPAPARIGGVSKPKGGGGFSCTEGAGAGRQNMGGKVGGGMVTWVFSVDLSEQFLNGARSGEQEPCSCLHCGRHSGVK